MSQPVFVFSETQTTGPDMSRAVIPSLVVAIGFLLLAGAAKLLAPFGLDESDAVGLAVIFLATGVSGGLGIYIVMRLRAGKNKRILTVDPGGISLYTGSGMLNMPGDHGSLLRRITRSEIRKTQRELDTDRAYSHLLSPLAGKNAYCWRLQSEHGEWRLNDLEWQWAMTRSNWPEGVEPKSVTAALEHCGIRPDTV